MSAFHEGEVAVQERAGLRARAMRLEPMLEPGGLDLAARRYLADQTLLILTARDGNGVLWTSAVRGAPGFLDTDGPTLTAHAAPRAGDPLCGVAAGQPAGALVMDLATRRRLRINGLLSASGPRGLTIEIEQAYGNCRKYIVPRDLEPPDAAGDLDGPPVRYAGRSLQPSHHAWIAAAQTMFLGTAHPSRGPDASHRGGPEGFVEAVADRLWWPDYPGNDMFNSLGNIAVDPRASLLFVDFDRWHTLHLAGRAEIDWTLDGHPDLPEGIGRGVSFSTESVVEVGGGWSATAGPTTP